MNSDLKNKNFSVPNEVISKLSSALTSYKEGGNTKGYKRAKGIVNSKEISYSQIKRIKNYFDKYEGEGSDPEYNLNGGDDMKQWVNTTLKNNRDSIHNVKRAKEMGGLENSFRKTHEKNTELNGEETDVKIPKIHKGSKGNYLMNNKTVYEAEIKKMIYLIEYMDNNNNKIL